MRLAWRKEAFINGLKDATAYRWEFLIEIISLAMVPVFIQWVIWNAVFKIGGQPLMAGMPYEELMHYTLMTLLFSPIRKSMYDFDLQEMIRSGALSQYLLKPVGVVEFFYLRGVASCMLILGVCCLFGMMACYFFGLDPFRMLTGMLLALMGNVLHYQIGAILSTAAFLWEDAFSILMVKNMVVSFLSGELIPLTLFPENMRWIYESTPFYLYVFGPTQYALGKWSHLQMLHAFGIAFLWMLGLWGLVKVSWSLGFKKYSSLGG